MTTPNAPRSQPVRANELYKWLSDLFPRVDTKLQVIQGVNLAMLAVVGQSVARVEVWDWRLVPAVLAVALIGVSLVELYRAAFPKLMERDTKSLIYFGAIARRAEAEYIDELVNADPAELERDLARQIWRSAILLDEKFARVNKAFRFTAFAILPWVVWLAVRPT